MDDYYNVVEVESAIANLAAHYGALCTLVELPNATAESRVSHALVVSTDPGAGRDAVLLTGGVHGREWGTCECLVMFAADLLRAYTSNAGLQYGALSVAAAELKAFLDRRDLIVFPLVNPDGRAFSQANDSGSKPGWRKNRRPFAGSGTPRVGVDVNRNFDIVWDFRKRFAASVAPASDDPANDNYHGTAPFSEAESCNVKWLLDTRPQVRWLVDLHSPTASVLYNWGIDETQSVAKTKNFRSPRWDHKRGVPADAYGEYKPKADADQAQALAKVMADAIAKVRGKVYHAVPSFTYDPVSGTMDDYAYARQWSTPARPRIHAFVIEHGEQFHPAWSVMEGIVGDVCGGLLAFCVAVS